MQTGNIIKQHFSKTIYLGSLVYIPLRNLKNSKIGDFGNKFTLLKLAKNCGFAVPILPSLILNKKNGGHNILWSAFYLIFEDISIYP